MRGLAKPSGNKAMHFSFLKSPQHAPRRRTAQWKIRCQWDREPKGSEPRGSLGGGFPFLKDREQDETTQDSSMTGLLIILFTLLTGFSLLAFLYARRRGGSLTDIRGPESSSFWLGTFN